VDGGSNPAAGTIHPLDAGPEAAENIGAEARREAETEGLSLAGRRRLRAPELLANCQ
jgi:hypothetical protein